MTRDFSITTIYIRGVEAFAPQPDGRRFAPGLNFGTESGLRDFWMTHSPSHRTIITDVPSLIQFS